MAPGKQNLTITHGDSFYQEWQIPDGVPSKRFPTMSDIQQDITNGVLVPRDMTNAVSVVIKLAGKEDGSSPIATLTSGFSDRVNGKIFGSLTKEQTESFTFTKAFWSVRVNYSSTESETHIEGSVVLNKVPA